MAQGEPFLGGGSGSPPGVQNIVQNLSNLVVAVNALTAQISTQFGTGSVYAVSDLPITAAPARAFVSDSTVAAATHFGAAVVGGGAYYVPVYWDNVSWKIG